MVTVVDVDVDVDVVDVVLTYSDDGWWFNRLAEDRHDPEAPVRYESAAEAATVGRALADRTGREHRVKHA